MHAGAECFVRKGGVGLTIPLQSFYTMQFFQGEATMIVLVNHPTPAVLEAIKDEVRIICEIGCHGHNKGVPIAYTDNAFSLVGSVRECARVGVRAIIMCPDELKGCEELMCMLAPDVARLIKRIHPDSYMYVFGQFHSSGSGLRSSHLYMRSSGGAESLIDGEIPEMSTSIEPWKNRYALIARVIMRALETNTVPHLLKDEFPEMRFPRVLREI